MYEVPKITDLGKISEHVLQPNGFTSPNNEDGHTEGIGGEGTAGGVGVAAGSSGGLAGLGLIGGLFAALGRRSNQAASNETSGDEPERDRANER